MEISKETTEMVSLYGEYGCFAVRAIISNGKIVSASINHRDGSYNRWYNSSITFTKMVELCNAINALQQLRDALEKGEWEWKQDAVYDY